MWSTLALRLSNTTNRAIRGVDFERAGSKSAENVAPFAYNCMQLIPPQARSISDKQVQTYQKGYEGSTRPTLPEPPQTSPKY